MVKFKQAATRVQKTMITAMIAAYIALLIFAVVEIRGVMSASAEDTLSEWVWDLPFPVMLAVSVLFVLTGAIFIWAGGHFLEGFSRRRKIEDDNWKEEPPA